MQPINAEDNQWRFSQRPARWYEWLFVLALLLLAGGVRAAGVYKCTDAAGGIAYQQQACAAGAQQTTIALAAIPATQSSPHYALAADIDAPQRRTHETARVARESSKAVRTPAEAQGYECRTANGEVFYRHTACPRSIAGGSPTPSHSARSGSRSSGAGVSVSSRRISRDEACTQMHRAGAIGRAGHEHDEALSTYDRNLGRDPCR